MRGPHTGAGTHAVPLRMQRPLLLKDADGDVLVLRPSPGGGVGLSVNGGPESAPCRLMVCGACGDACRVDLVDIGRVIFLPAGAKQLGELWDAAVAAEVQVFGERPRSIPAAAANGGLSSPRRLRPAAAPYRRPPSPASPPSDSSVPPRSALSLAPPGDADDAGRAGRTLSPARRSAPLPAAVRRRAGELELLREQLALAHHQWRAQAARCSELQAELRQQRAAPGCCSPSTTAELLSPPAAQPPRPAPAPAPAPAAAAAPPASWAQEAGGEALLDDAAPTGPVTPAGTAADEETVGAAGPALPPYGVLELIPVAETCGASGTPRESPGPAPPSPAGAAGLPLARQQRRRARLAELLLRRTHLDALRRGFARLSLFASRRHCHCCGAELACLEKLEAGGHWWCDQEMRFWAVRGRRAQVHRQDGSAEWYPVECEEGSVRIDGVLLLSVRKGTARWGDGDVWRLAER